MGHFHEELTEADLRERAEAAEDIEPDPGIEPPDGSYVDSSGAVLMAEP